MRASVRMRVCPRVCVRELLHTNGNILGGWETGGNTRTQTHTHTVVELFLMELTLINSLSVSHTHTHTVMELFLMELFLINSLSLSPPPAPPPLSRARVLSLSLSLSLFLFLSPALRSCAHAYVCACVNCW